MKPSPNVARAAKHLSDAFDAVAEAMREPDLPADRLCDLGLLLGDARRAKDRASCLDRPAPANHGTLAGPDDGALMAG